jgi:uncharacterized damage-inducible protein DinB
MDPKTLFLQHWEREHAVTLNVLKHFPADKQDLKPAEKCKSAKDLAFVFVAEYEFIGKGAVAGAVDFTKKLEAPATIGEVIKQIEAIKEPFMTAVKGMSDADWNGNMAFMVGPGKMGEVRRAEILWMMLMDMVHHRGQFSIYNRIAGGKVPSIYGPSADEPWM